MIKLEKLLPEDFIIKLHCASNLDVDRCTRIQNFIEHEGNLEEAYNILTTQGLYDFNMYMSCLYYGFNNNLKDELLNKR